MGDLGNHIAGLLRPEDRSPTYDWAKRNVELFPPILRTGPFDVSISRHFIGIFDALDDGRTREVNVLKPVRGGGSLIGDIHLASAMARAPGPYLNVYQSDDDGKLNFFDRLEKILSKNVATQKLLPAKYDWSDIKLTNGIPLYTGGPGLNNLQSKPAMYLRLDECWIYPPGRMAEAEARTAEFLAEQMSKILRISQAGPAERRYLDDDEWHRTYYRGSIHEWEVQCPHCHKYFMARFAGVRDDGSFWGIVWDRHMLPNGDWNPARCIPTIRFECEHCRQPVLDCEKTKSEWNRTGQYRLFGEENKKRQSFHWEALIAHPWDDLVELWLDACNAERRGDLKPKLQFYQKRRAMFMDEQGLLKSGLNLAKSVYEINSPGELGRCMEVDRQEEDLFWVEVRAWFAEECRQLFFGKCYGFAALEQIREQFKVSPNHVLIDSQYLPKGDNGVYRACCKHGWIAVKGDKEPHFIHALKGGKRVLKSYAPLAWGDPESGTSEGGRQRCPVIRFSKYQMNQKVDELVSSGRWKQQMNPADPEMAKEYSAQMAGRIRKTEHNAKTGETKVFYFETKNDHARDLANMGTLFAILNDFLPDPATERLTKSETARVAVPE